MKYRKNFFFISFILIFYSSCSNRIKASVLSCEYNFPKNKQGIADRNYNALSDKRYDILKNDLDIGIQKYNYYWRDGEGKILSSRFPLTCQKGYFLFPKNEKQKKILKINRYHCYKIRFVNQWEKRFKKNLEYDIKIALVLWTTPKNYQDKGCIGFKFANKNIKGGCYPTPEHYIDYEDWIRFTAYRFGKYVDHYIVWNEVDSSNWADTSSLLYSKNKMKDQLKFQMQRAFNIYTTLLKKTIISVNLLDKKCMNYTGQCKNLVYVSLTNDWYSRKVFYKISKNGEIHIRWRNMNLLDYIWDHLGLKYDWAIAIHPYGNVYKKINTNSLNFSTLKDLSNYQKNQINVHKTSNLEWLAYPQSKIFASEQNVGHHIKKEDWEEKAKYICESYKVALEMPQLIAITHNHFQDNIKKKNKKPSKYTMIPREVGEDLREASKYATFSAYKSTSRFIWGKKNEHYCCRKLKLGCKNE